MSYTPVTETELQTMETPALHAALQERKSRADEIIRPHAAKAKPGQNAIELLGAEDWERVKALSGDATMIQAVIAGRQERSGVAAQFDAIGKAATSIAGMPSVAVPGAADFGPITPGQAFVMSKVYRDAKAAGRFKVSVKEADGAFPQFEVPLGFANNFPLYRKVASILMRSHPEFFAKATAINSDSASGGGFILPEFDLVPEQLARDSLDVIGLLRLQPTESNTIEWLKQTTRITGADVVGEFTDTADSISGKPQGEANWERDTMPVRTVAVSVAVVNQQLDDAPEIRGVIDEDLRFNVEEKLNQQALSGTGSGNQLTGLLTTLTAEGITDVDYDPTGTPTHDNILDALLDAWVQIRLAGEPLPSGTLINYADWYTARTVKASGTGDYLMGPPSSRGPLVLWDIPLVGTNNISAGTALVGNFQMARLHMREESGIRLGYVNNDFLANRVRLLYEIRAAVTVRRPGAFRRVTGLDS